MKVLILGSGQLLVLGVIGEYLGRLYMQSKGRPDADPDASADSGDTWKAIVRDLPAVLSVEVQTLP